MPLVGNKFAPVMPMQQLVQCRQPHLSTQRGFEFRLNLTNYQDAALGGCLKKRLEQLCLLFVREVLSAPAPTGWQAAIGNDLPTNELVA